MIDIIEKPPEKIIETPDSFEVIKKPKEKESKFSLKMLLKVLLYRLWFNKKRIMYIILFLFLFLILIFPEAMALSISEWINNFVGTLTKNISI